MELDGIRSYILGRTAATLPFINEVYCRSAAHSINTDGYDGGLSAGSALDISLKTAGDPERYYVFYWINFGDFAYVRAELRDPPSCESIIIAVISNSGISMRSPYDNVIYHVALSRNEKPLMETVTEFITSHNAGSGFYHLLCRAKGYPCRNDYGIARSLGLPI